MKTKIDEKGTYDLLRADENGVNVVFTKKDGTERAMLCTLIESKIPGDKQPKTPTEVASTAGQAVRVFDIDKGEWRSFRWDSVKTVNGVTYA
jgi:hypothetical protein